MLVGWYFASTHSHHGAPGVTAIVCPLRSAKLWMFSEGWNITHTGELYGAKIWIARIPCDLAVRTKPESVRLKGATPAAIWGMVSNTPGPALFRVSLRWAAL